MAQGTRAVCDDTDSVTADHFNFLPVIREISGFKVEKRDSGHYYSGTVQFVVTEVVNCNESNIAYYSPLYYAFDNKHPDRDYWVTFTCPEFTTLCPKTGQPDFATLTIRYIPAKRLVESKSLKLYLFGFRNHGDFHEDVVNVIYNDLVKLLKPKYMEVYGKFAARGGISIDPYVNGGVGAKYKALAQRRFENWNGVRD